MAEGFNVGDPLDEAVGSENIAPQGEQTKKVEVDSELDYANLDRKESRSILVEMGPEEYRKRSFELIGKMIEASKTQERKLREANLERKIISHQKIESRLDEYNQFNAWYKSYDSLNDLPENVEDPILLDQRGRYYLVAKNNPDLASMKEERIEQHRNDRWPFENEVSLDYPFELERGGCTYFRMPDSRYNSASIFWSMDLEDRNFLRLISDASYVRNKLEAIPKLESEAQKLKDENGPEGDSEGIQAVIDGYKRDLDNYGLTEDAKSIFG